MEIKEILSYFLNSDSNILEVSFRTIEDEDDVLRNDNINYSIVSEYGFELETETFDFFGEEFDEDLGDDEEKIELDEDELISFLNEYYTINQDSLPKAEFY
jgi:hypothetical protein